MELFGNSIIYNVSKLEVDIELNLTNCSSSNQSTKSSLGSIYTTNIYPDEHTDFSTFSVYMGGVDITSQVTTYNVGYNTITIPIVNSDISITSVCGVETYTITKTLTGCTSSNSASTTVYGASYTTTITASPNYTMEGATVVITMDGVDITSTAWDSTNNTITINNVTGNITFNIVAVYNASSIEFIMDYASAVISGIFPPRSSNLRAGDKYSFTGFDFYYESGSDMAPFISSAPLGFLRIYNGTYTFRFTANTGFKVSDIVVTALPGTSSKPYKVSLSMNNYTDPPSINWAYTTSSDGNVVEIGGTPVTNALIDFKPAGGTQARITSIKVTLVSV